MMATRRGNHEGSIYGHKDGFAGQVTIEGRRRTFYGKTRREVQGKIRAAVNEGERGIAPSRENLSLEQFLTRWLEEAVRPGVSPRTYASYDYHVRLHFIPALGKRKLRALQPSDLQGLYARLLGQGLAPKTVRNAHIVIHKALEQATGWDLAPRNVADLVRPPRVERREPNTLSAGEVRRLWAAIAGTRWEALLVLAVATGLRQGEMLGLRWGDLDPGRAALQVRRQLHRDKTYGTPKAKSRRRIDLAAPEIRALARHKARQDALRLARGAAYEDRDLVFCTDLGRPLGWRNVTRAFKRLLGAAGLKDVRFHDLRHTNATLLLEAEVHPKIVQERLGHSTIAVTLDIYSHAIPSLGRGAADRLHEVLGDGEAEGGTGRGGDDGEAGDELPY
ncbi:MAG: Integrase [uncultured Thermomicrobiales bacterium]|uniref:Integrase n=1 Tax=uncultured Thermomicrobiales bacterium TaxID=1645740 RepID=A0A6J4VV91_9BACT|nr:MAG: Integrase [uncultured Thermomicrobiales bacterium]